MTAEFKSVARKFIQRVEAHEPHTLAYEWFLDEKQSSCIVLEAYQDNDALFNHLENIHDLYEQLFAVCEITRLQVFGNISEALKSAHLPQSEFYNIFSGVSREVADPP